MSTVMYKSVHYSQQTVPCVSRGYLLIMSLRVCMCTIVYISSAYILAAIVEPHRNKSPC